MTNQTDTAQTLTGSLLLALGNAPWLSPSDAATIQWAIFLAAELDDHGDKRVVANLGKLYESALHSLGLSPEARSAKTELPSEEVNPLAKIRVLRESVAKVADSKQESRPKPKRATDSASRGGKPSAAAVAKDSSK